MPAGGGQSNRGDAEPGCDRGPISEPWPVKRNERLTPHPMTTRSLGKKSVFTRRWKWNKRAPLRSFYNAWLRLFYRLVIRHTVVGLENVPTSGPPS